VLLAAAGLLGWADSWQALRAAAARVTSIQAAFVQEKHLPILAQPLVSEGLFVFQRPDRLRWEYRHPVRSLLLLAEGRVQRYVQAGDGLAPERGAGLQAMDMILAEMRLWLSGDFERSPAFAARLDPAGRVVLTPRDGALAGFIQRIELELDERPGVIGAVTIYEGPDSFTRIRFSGVRLNQPLDPSLFGDPS
jgi:outer membrane lipoprotein-sorting protein